MISKQITLPNVGFQLRNIDGGHLTCMSLVWFISTAVISFSLKSWKSCSLKRNHQNIHSLKKKKENQNTKKSLRLNTVIHLEKENKQTTKNPFVCLLRFLPPKLLVMLKPLFPRWKREISRDFLGCRLVQIQEPSCYSHWAVICVMTNPITLQLTEQFWRTQLLLGTQDFSCSQQFI